MAMQLVRSPTDGVVFLRDESTKTRWRVTSRIGERLLIQIYGGITVAAMNRISMASGYREGPNAGTIFGGARGMQAVISGEKSNPFSFGPNAPETGPRIGTAPINGQFVYSPDSRAKYHLIVDGKRYDAWTKAEQEALLRLYGAPTTMEARHLAPFVKQASEFLAGVPNNSGQLGNLLNEVKSPFPGAIQEPEPRTFLQNAKVMFPFMPDNLLESFAKNWEETGDPQLAMDMLRETPEYEAAFPGIKKPSGQLAMSEADYTTYVDRAKHLMKSMGIPEGFYDEPEDFAELINNSISLNELQSRLTDGYTAVQFAPQEVRDQMATFYGAGSDGALAAFFLDPERAEAVIMKQVTAAQIGARATMTKFGDLSKTEAERLAGLGIDPNAAMDQFTALGMQKELFGILPGEAGKSITRGEQLGAAFEGDAEARNKILRRQETRTAKFSGGGGASPSEEGIVGLRSATS